MLHTLVAVGGITANPHHHQLNVSIVSVGNNSTHFRLISLQSPAGRSWVRVSDVG